MQLAAILGCLSGFNILLAFCYQWYILTSIGPGIYTDALFAGIIVPDLLFLIIPGSLIHVLVPYFSTRGLPDIRSDAWTLIHFFGLLFIIITLCLYLSATVWVPWTVPGFSPQTMQITISLVHIHLVGMVFSAINPVLWSFYHARRRFIWVETSQVIATLAGFLFLIWKLPQHGIVIAAWALVIRSAGQAILLIPGLESYQFINLRNGTVKEVWMRLVPLILGSACFRCDQLVDRFLASMASAGQLSLLYYTRQIYSAGTTILIKAIIGPAVPELSKRYNCGDGPSFQRLIRHRTMWLTIITVFVFFVVLVFGKSFLNLLFGHGKFDPSSITTLYWLMVAMAGFWIGGTLSQIFSTGFYTQKDTKTPTKIGILGFAIGIVLKIGGFYYYGIIGIAVGTSLHFLLNATVMKWVLNRRNQDTIFPQAIV